jgi:O-antigen/teichoic acid export membrane protein
MSDRLIEKKKRVPKILLESLWVGIGQTIGAIGSVVTIALLTRLLSPPEYGILALGLTGTVLVQQLIAGPISNAALRFYIPAHETNQLGEYLSDLRSLLFKGTAAVLLIVVFVVSLLAVFRFFSWLPMVIIASGYAIVFGYSSSLGSIQIAARHRIVAAWHDGIGSWMRLFAAILMIKYLGATGLSALLGNLGAGILILTSQYFFLKINILNKVERFQNDLGKCNSYRMIKKMQSYALPFSIWGIFTWAQLSSDRWALDLLHGSEAVGYYAPLLQLGYYPISMITNAGMQLFTPIIFGFAGDGSDKNRIAKMLKYNKKMIVASSSLGVAGILLAIKYHSWIFSRLIAPEYRMVSPLLPWMVLSGVTFAVGQIASLAILGTGKTSTLIVPKIATAFLAIALNYIGAKLGGVQGVVYASVCFSMIYFAWIVLLNKSIDIRTQ